VGSKRLVGWAVMKSRVTPIPGSGASAHMHRLFHTVEAAEAYVASSLNDRATYEIKEVYVEI
jgi:hypothetical protein